MSHIKYLRYLYSSMPFYYDDFLKIWKFDETDYDKLVSPYYNIDRALQKRKET